MKSENFIEKCVSKLIVRRRRLLFTRVLLKMGSALSFLLTASFFALLWISPATFSGWTRTDIFLLGFLLIGFSWALAAIAAAVRALLARFPPVYTAKCLDDHYGFEDQVASAVELSSVDTEFACAARERADQMVRSSQPSKVFPLRFPRIVVLSLAAFIILVASAIIFEVDLSAQEMRKEISVLAERLRRYAAEREKDARTKEEKDILKRLKELAEQLKKKDISKQTALEEAASLKKALAQKQQELLMKGLDLRKAAEALAKCKDTKPIADEMLRRNVKGAADRTKELSDAVKERKALKENPEFESLSEAFRLAAPHMGPFSATSEKIARASKFYERDATSQELENLARQMKADAEGAELSDLLRG